MLVIGGSYSGDKKLVGTGTGVGSCGELVQGFTSQGQPFHITFPIQKSATVTVTLDRSAEFSIQSTDPSLQKIDLAIQKTAEYLDIEPCKVRLTHWTDLDIGKGMGSSTADIVGAARALANAVGRQLSPLELATIASSVESSNGSMYPGLVAFNQKTGDTLMKYPWWPQFIVVMVIPPSRLNTESVDFNGKKDFGAEFSEMLTLLEDASKGHDSKVFAQCATRSAAINQQFVPNPYHAMLEDRLDSFDAIGINVGHTGTLTGVLFDANSPGAVRSAAFAAVEIQSMFPLARIETTLTPAFLED